MKTSSIFNLKRFCGLFGSGFNRKRGSFVTVLIWFSAAMYSLQFLLQTVNQMDPQKAETVLTRIYLLGYIITLTILSLKGYSNKEKAAAWTLLPASAFEKFLFRFIRIFVFGSIVYFTVIWAVDQLINPNNNHIGIKEVLAIIPPAPYLPLWLDYIFFFFYCTMVPMIGLLEFLTPYTSFNTPNRQWVIPWCVCLIAQLTLQLPSIYVNSEVKSAGFVVVIIMAAFSFGCFMITLLSSLIESCKGNR